MSFYFCFTLGDSSIADSAFKGPQQEIILKFMTPESKQIFSLSYMVILKLQVIFILKFVLLKVHLLI